MVNDKFAEPLTRSLNEFPHQMRHDAHANQCYDGYYRKLYNRICQIATLADYYERNQNGRMAQISTEANLTQISCKPIDNQEWRESGHESNEHYAEDSDRWN
jgi:hypothetical protein